MQPSSNVKIGNLLIPWYLAHQRSLPWRRTRDPYCIWVSEVMLQQTQVATAIPYYRRFMDRYPRIRQLAEADVQDVLKVWEGLGYYARARNLHLAAQRLQEHANGNIPTDISAFKKLPGVGDYIASAVLSIAFDRPYAVVDGNVKRVLARLFLIDAPVNKPSAYAIFKGYCSRIFDARQPGTFNQALMELGALICRPRSPGCDHCPLASLCEACQSNSQNRYPKRIRKRPVPQIHVAVGIIRKNNHLLITRRPFEGLLGGLWEFPGGKVAAGETAAQACRREIKEEVGLTVALETDLTRVKHAYTHFKIIMDVFVGRWVSGRVVLQGPTDHRWIEMADLDDYPFPGANRKFIPLFKSWLADQKH